MDPERKALAKKEGERAFFYHAKEWGHPFTFWHRVMGGVKGLGRPWWMVTDLERRMDTHYNILLDR